MLACMRTAAVYGIEACGVQVEVDVSFGLPSFHMVGLPDASVRESRDRVKSAIRNSGLEFPPHRITVNLAPADIRKGGSAFDLPIALGILAASGGVTRRDVHDVLLIGELSLDGGIQPARGVLPIAAAARRDRFQALLLPRPNHAEASVVAGLTLYGVESLLEAVRALNDPEGFSASVTPPPPPPQAAAPADLDFSDVHGQAMARRALEIAAAGGHNTLMIGPPGSGKTMMARRIAGILPPLTFDEALEVTSIHSVAGLLPAGVGLLAARPFRAPHHTISDVALVGGGAHPRPGEISLAHHGVLFLDEMAEFSRHVLEVLRQPIEEGCVRIARAARTCTFPARFMLVGAMNPCPCGYHGDTARACRCTPQQIDRYAGRLSGPLRDRLDLTVPVAAMPARELSEAAGGEPSWAIRARVIAARERQAARDGMLNARLHGRRLRAATTLDADARRLRDAALEKLSLTARGHDRVLRVARTIADLDAADRIGAQHLAEALQFRGEG
ncbi:MAG TPA: YifB family Mg chelatase-like AAA ATPase [Vicinamibacterales bacterium]|nr:YifB family Mg chelatase-like AAA ATPase [Vicinamibacterales bacterium]